jgi:ribosomal protein L32
MPTDQSRRERRRSAHAVTARATAAATNSGESAAAEIICKNIKPIGSRVSRRVCGTEAQWSGSSEKTAAHAQEEMRQMRARAGLTGPAPPGPASLSPATMR